MKLLANMFIRFGQLRCAIWVEWHRKEKKQQKLMFASVMLAFLGHLGGLFVKDTPSEFVFFSSLSRVAFERFACGVPI